METGRSTETLVCHRSTPRLNLRRVNFKSVYTNPGQLRLRAVCWMIGGSSHSRCWEWGPPNILSSGYQGLLPWG